MALSALASAGCRGGEPPRHLDRIAVAETEASRALAGRGEAPEDVARAAGSALAAAAGFRQSAAPEGAQRYLGRVSIHRADAVASGPGGAAAARVLLTIELAPVGEGLPIRETGLAIEPLQGGPRPLDDALHAAVERALAAAAQSVALHLGAAAKDDGALVRDLGSGDAAVRDHAVRVLAERRNPAAIPALVERLQDADTDVADRAVGALAEIGDRRAVEPLIDLAHRRGGRGVEQYARIVGDLGGPLARAWLETLAAGHPDAEVRDAAEESLAALARRAEPRDRAAAAR